MTPEERDRLTRVEQEMRDVRDDVHEIKESLKKLEAIAAAGNGAFRTVLIVGGFLGWAVGIIMGLIAYVKGASQPHA